ncbi:MAG: hypothetical protein ACLQCB_01050 [Spirochaetia bacterium]
MYKSMIRNGIRSGALLVCFLLAAASAKCLEKSIELGKEHLWGDMQSLDGVTRVDGKWGFKDLALSYGEYAPDGSTELLLHFDNESPPEPEGAYRFIDSAPRIENKVFALGGGSALFNGERSGVSLEAPPGALFAPGAVWGDVSIEFWLYPATLSDGETVLSWTGAARAGEPGSSQLAAQSMRCYIKERKLVWDFQDFFALPTGSWLPVTLSGTRKLIPRAWHHHLLRFNARSGLLEYLIDGVPEAIAHVTDNGRESGSIAVPRLGLQEAGPLVLGAGFTGFLDELRVSRRVVDDPMIQRFAGKTGTATSSIIDLGFTATRISRIEATYTTPGDSGVEFYYQVSDVWRNPRLLKTDTDWVPFTPPGDFKETLKGRYLQLMVVLYPDGTRNLTPRVSSLRVVYEPNEPPAPPAGLLATPGNGKVTLSWRPVSELDVKGYMLYYGTSPHNYLGTGAAQGDSPVDAGAKTSIEIDGLTNGNLYYFSVVAYDDSEPPQKSDFSPEVSARPSRIYK